MSTNVELLSVTHPVGVKVWWQLLEYRIQIRLLLRGIVKLHDPALPDSDDPSYEKLLKRVHALGLITDEESGTLDEIRRHTHYFEWGTQDIPSKDEIGFVLRESPKMIEV